MAADNPSPTGQSSATPTGRRSSRPPRSAGRNADRDARRPGSTGSPGSAARTLVVWTGVGVVVAAVLIGAAVVMTRQPAQGTGFTPIPPSVVTPSDIPASGRTLGNPAAPVTIDVYEDFRCTGCFAYSTEIEPAVEVQYVATGKAKIVHHDFLVIDRGGITESRDAANAARCAADQGKYWPLHDWLFANQSPAELPGYFTTDRLLALGKAAGLDMPRFEPCVRNGTHDQEIRAEQGPLRSRINATPSIFVNGAVVVNPANPQAIPTPAQIGAAVEHASKP